MALNHKKVKYKTEPEEIENFKKALGARMKELRLRSKRSAEAFANDIEISRTLYQTYEKGANVTAKNLVRITNGLGVSVKEFFSEGFDLNNNRH